MIRRLLAFALIATAGAFAQQVSLTGAGSTFAYPLYSSWASQYNKLHPNVQINYQSIGSGGGIRQLIAGTVDFGATDGPMTDKELAEAQQKRGTAILHFPTALGADAPSYNIPGVSAELKFTPAALAGIFLGHITKWKRSGDSESESRREAAKRQYRSHPSLGWLWHDLLLGRLPVEGKPGMEEQSWRGDIGELAGWIGWKRE